MKVTSTFGHFAGKSKSASQVGTGTKDKDLVFPKAKYHAEEAAAE